MLHVWTPTAPANVTLAAPLVAAQLAPCVFVSVAPSTAAKTSANFVIQNPSWAAAGAGLSQTTNPTIATMCNFFIRTLLLTLNFSLTLGLSGPSELVEASDLLFVYTLARLWFLYGGDAQKHARR